MKNLIEKIPSFLKNFYFIFMLGFLFWMFFFDSNDFISQFTMRNKLLELKEEKNYYEDKIKEVKEERLNLLSNRQHLEKFARENYLMRKKSEDVDVIINQ